ncbi:MAG TPA: tripartite tricarboxylate transporter substrate binding protein [Burkholderiales bacterium]|nr:tripartite tricarboxylate transporter substrate binding protein [Burkholderiales bacterium]
MHSVVALCFALVAAAAAAQDFPVRPVHVVVPYPPSGNVDITARTLEPALRDALGQAIVIDNRAGAGGIVGTAYAVKAPADGYTLLLGSSATITAGPAVFKHLAYNPLKDLVPIGSIQSVPIVLTVAPKTRAATFAEFVRLARESPGRVSIASAGTGSSNHLAIEMLMHQAKLELLHVPYKGSGPAIADLLGSQVDSMMDQLTASIGHIREGRIRALAISSLKRSPLLPDVPTLDEAGVKGYEAGTFTGLFAPAGTPAPIVEQLAAGLEKARASEAVRSRYQSLGGTMMDMSRAQFAAFVRADFEKWRKVAREANISLD